MGYPDRAAARSEPPTIRGGSRPIRPSDSGERAIADRQEEDVTRALPPGHRPKGYEENVSNKPQDMTAVRPPTASTGPARSSSPDVNAPASTVEPRKSRPADMTTVRTMSPTSTPPLSPRVADMTRVRPPEMGSGRSSAPAAPSSSARMSVPSAGEINRKVKRKRSGMLAIYWAAGIVAMLTAGGILTAMIARGDADKFIQKGAASGAPAAAPVAAPPAPVQAAAAAPTETPAVAAAPASAKKSDGVNAIPGTKPGTIVNLELWKKAGRGDPTLAAKAAAAPPPQAPTPTTPGAPGAAAAAPPTRPATKVLTPDNDPAVKLARDQLEATFK